MRIYLYLLPLFFFLSCSSHLLVKMDGCQNPSITHFDDLSGEEWENRKKIRWQRSFWHPLASFSAREIDLVAELKSSGIDCVDLQFVEVSLLYSDFDSFLSLFPFLGRTSVRIEGYYMPGFIERNRESF